MTDTISEAKDPRFVWPWSKDATRTTPLDWVANKDRQVREALIRRIGEKRGRPLLVMFHDGDAEIEKDDIRYLSELVDPLKGVPFDLMLHTPGGLTDATNALLEYL